MRQVTRKITLTVIVAAGLFVGMVKGQDARKEWINKMKARFENSPEKTQFNRDEVILDEIEMAAFHSL